MMRYFYTAAWAVVGGISLGQDSPPIELANKKGSRFVLVCDPDPILARVDQGSAIGRLVLKSFAGQRGTADFADALAAEVMEIAAERKKKIGGQPVLLFEAQGEIDVTLKGVLPERPEFIVASDAVDKRAVRQMHQSEIEAMKVAVAFESEVPSSFADVAEGTYLLNEAGKIVYSITLSMSGKATISTFLSEEAPKRILARYVALNQATDLDSVERLYCQMAEYGSDPLKAFLSGWAALEILIAKSFKLSEQAFLSPLTKAEQPNLRERFLGRIRGVMKDKYRLADKFIAVTAVLFPVASDDEVQEDYERFCRLKDLRDSIFHGEPFSERDLPVHELAALLRRYVLARIAAPNQGLNAEVPTSGAPSANP